MFTVGVCTCNRAGKLAHLLDSLERMRIPDGVAWELIVVDNNSTDTTAGLLADRAARRTLPLRHIFERRQGLAAAHNALLANAKGDVIAFTDDDCRVAPDWLEALAREFRDEALCLLGGRVELFNPEDRPTSIRRSRERLDLTGDTRTLDIMIGCNMAFRREIALRVGGFDTRFGSGCKVAPSADDIEFAYRVLRTGGRIAYSPDLVVMHDHGRSTDAQIRALNEVYALGRGAMYAKYLLQRDRAMARVAHWEVKTLLADAFRPAERKASLFVLWTLLRGAFRFLRLRGEGGELSTSRS